MSDQSRPQPTADGWKGMTPRDRGLSEPMVDDVFDLLADWRRRGVCRYFATTGASSAELDTLAAAVSRRGASVDGDTVEEVRAALTDDHLPRLDDAGVLDFDQRSEAVRYWGHPTVEKWAEHAAAVTER